MSDLIVFAGPTLSRDEVLTQLAAEVRPPAGRGDILRACALRPRVIGLVDGVFDRVPSVWHKELLWALSQGIRVLGAASMGALRAVELEPFGMEGVGEIFASFRDGRLEDDDEVAVAHGTGADGWRALSEAQVNIRATLAAAAGAAVVSPAVADALAAAAKALFYPDRSYPALLREGSRLRLPADELAAFERWLPQGRVDLKKQDARAMLARIREGTARPTPRPSFKFAFTDAWAGLRARVDAEPAGPQAAPHADAGTERELVVDELLLRGQHGRIVEGALARALCDRELARSGAAMDARAIGAAAEDFRREHALHAPDDFDAWLNEQRLADDDVDRFFRREAMVRRARTVLDAGLPAHLREQMQSLGIYGRVAARAAEKAQRLTRAGLQAVELADTGLSEAELWRWYFGDVLGIAVPADLDAYAAREHTDRGRLFQAVIREHCYLARAVERPPQNAAE